MRDTAQRRAIRKALEDGGRPLSRTEILAAARRVVPRLGIATVYRTLKNLEAEGLVRPVDLPGNVPRYEVSAKHHHHHFHCAGCGRVFEVDSCPGDLAHMAPRGFVVEDHDVILYGRCPDCARPRKRDAARRRGTAPARQGPHRGVKGSARKQR
ncbi:MAG: Fur family transcriptional regulator [Vicinamibacterales bacterium]